MGRPRAGRASTGHLRFRALRRAQAHAVARTRSAGGQAALLVERWQGAAVCERDEVLVASPRLAQPQSQPGGYCPGSRDPLRVPTGNPVRGSVTLARGMLHGAHRARRISGGAGALLGCPLPSRASQPRGGDGATGCTAQAHGGDAADGGRAARHAALRGRRQQHRGRPDGYPAPGKGGSGTRENIFRRLRRRRVQRARLRAQGGGTLRHGASRNYGGLQGFCRGTPLPRLDLRRTDGGACGHSHLLHVPRGEEARERDALRRGGRRTIRRLFQVPVRSVLRGARLAAGRAAQWALARRCERPAVRGPASAQHGGDPRDSRSAAPLRVVVRGFRYGAAGARAFRHDAKRSR